jgi:hypothetical protein
MVLAIKFRSAMSDDPNHRGNSRRWVIRGSRTPYAASTPTTSTSARSIGSTRALRSSKHLRAHRPRPPRQIRYTGSSSFTASRTCSRLPIRAAETGFFVAGPQATGVEAQWAASERSSMSHRQLQPSLNETGPATWTLTVHPDSEWPDDTAATMYSSIRWTRKLPRRDDGHITER